MHKKFLENDPEPNDNGKLKVFGAQLAENIIQRETDVVKNIAKALKSEKPKIQQMNTA